MDWWRRRLVDRLSYSFSTFFFYFNFPAHASYIVGMFSIIFAIIEEKSSPYPHSSLARLLIGRHVRPPISTTSHATVRVASAHDASITYDAAPTPC